jgi:hypothetical protein
VALTRQQSVHTYLSAAGGYSYYFDVVVDAQGIVSVRNIRTPTGGICDPYTSLPSTVTDDIQAATELVALLQLETEVDSGTVVFSGQTTQAVVIAGGVLNNTNYRVVFTTPDGTVLEATGKTITGFTATAATTYGTVLDPKTVAYSVLVKTAQTSNLSGVVTITNADAGSVAVVFTTALSTVNYRVLLEPRGFFDAHVPTATKLKTGFIIELGHVPAVGSDVDVGYDVFV